MRFTFTFLLGAKGRQPIRRGLLALPLVGLLAGPVLAQTPATFATSVNYTTGGTGVVGLAVADVNADGKADLLTSNFNEGTVAVLLGTGTGTFGAATTFSSGGNLPVGVTAADVNGDNKLDFIVANQSSGTIGVLLGTGMGTFGTATTFGSGGVYPTDLVVTDVNGDNKLDILASNQTSGTLAVLLGTGAGTFGTAATFGTGLSSLLGLAVADLNGDGKRDVVVGTYTGSSVAVLLGTGTGTFGTAASFTVGAGLGPGRLALGDVNGDNKLDILTANYANATAAVLLGTGTGSFGTATTYGSGGGSPQDIAVADVNGDNKLDILTANSGNTTAGVLLGTGMGTFGAATAFSTGSAGGYPYAIRAADVNGDGRPDLLVANYFGNSLSVLLNTTVAPTLTALNPIAGPVGTSVTLTGTNLGSITTVKFNGVTAPGFVVNSATSITVSVPAGATTGPVSVQTATSTATGPNFTVTYPDLVVNTTTTVAAGIYNSITVNNPGVATLAGNVTVNTSTVVNTGATLNDGCFVLSGAGNFTLAAGATLGICHAQGLSATPGAGAIQNTGFRSFSTDATYVYNGTTAQVTGNALPYLVRALTTTNPNDLTMTANTSVTQTVTVAGSGNLVSNTALTLLSSAAGTALVVNSGTGIVVGSTVVQRYISPSKNPGLGYRHLAPPVNGATVASLATTGFTPVVNGAYNSSPTPGLVTPFPTVYYYDQSQLVTASNNLAAFDKGWGSPVALSYPLTSGLGYTVNMAGGLTVNFSGTLLNGNRSVGVSRNAAGSANAADAGWALIGNPYASPLDFSLVAAADRAGFDAAMYVFESTGPYAGSYRPYVNNLPAANALVGSSQAFFVRVSSTQTSATLQFRNSQRVTSYTTQVPLYRTAADARARVQLDLHSAVTGLTDAFYAYAEAGATPAFDGEFDAAKLPNSTGLNLAGLAASGEGLAIDGRPAFTPATSIALTVGVPAAGTYTLTAAELANLPTGLTPYLVDARTGSSTALNPGSVYSFSVSATEAQALITGRFTLRFGPLGVLATTPTLSAAEVSVFPNPAHERFTALVPAVAGASIVQADLLNGLGQVVCRLSTPLPAAGARLNVPTAMLAPGLYVLRLTAGPSTITKRVVIQ
ncbi:FG-GAP-like repeat-containing protein [Hymenobacter negativus]|uniref:VCBS repeat-containing protein n=1 Tax=Hymenobacter negativus TaxID=2795026 RepID=A0ABS3QBZ8_9BACT|nr:FG-GAP-like repeat-containing protein [Hymenobacter negativus]MBO2008772.1 VCBS repeat-containing protein [Hymenobacter negativus]